MEKYLITDKNLLKFINESDIQKIAELFSFGRFAEIIDNYFRKEKNDKNEPVKLIDDFFVIENLKKNNISNNNKEKNIGNQNNKKENNFDLDINTFYSNSSNNLRINKKNDFSLNMLDRSNTNTINNIDNKNNEQYLGSIGIIEDYYNDVNVEKELDFVLIDKFEDDKLTQQLLLTIVIYCLMRIKSEVELRNIFDKYNISTTNSIFPLILLKAKFYFKINNISQCLDIYSQSINKYNDFKSNNKNENNNIIYIETYNQNFFYFNNIFNYLFAMDNIDSKIKKLYYEQKFCLYQLGFYSEGFKLLIELYNKYPTDVQIQFELGKDSIYLSKYDIFKEMLEMLQKSVNEEQNMNKRTIFINYYIYLQGLSFLAQDKIENTRKCFTEILKNDSTNIIAINNNALLSIYENKSKESYNMLNLVENPN